MSEELKKAKEELKSLADKTNKSAKAKAFLKKWIGKYDGKVISWKLAVPDGEANFHLIFTPHGVKFSEGVYPSPDMTWVTDIATWRGLYSGEKSTKDVMMSGKLWIWGNFNEWNRFHDLRVILGEAKPVQVQGS